MKVSLKLLIIEDSPEVTYSMVDHFPKGEFEPLWLRIDNQEEFESVIKRQAWDLVICDYKSISANDTFNLKYIKKKIPDTPLILISDTVNEKIVNDAMKSGANDFINIHNIERLIFSIKRELRDIELKRERSRTEKELSQRTLEISHLYKAGETLGNSLDLLTIYTNTYEIVKNFMECNCLVISTFNEIDNLVRCDFIVHRGELYDVAAFPVLKYNPEGIGTQSDVIKSGKSLLIPDFGNAIKYSKSKFFVDSKGKVYDEMPQNEEPDKSALMVPIKYNNKVIGVIQVLSTNLNTYDEHHLKFMEAFSPQIAAAIVNAKLYEQAQKEIEERKNVESQLRNRSAEIESLYQGGVKLGNSLDLNTVFKNTQEIIQSRIPCNDFVVSSFDPESNLISCAYASHDGFFVDVKNFPKIPLEPEGKGTQSRVIRDGKSRLMNNYLAELNNSNTKFVYNEKGILKDKLTGESEIISSAILVPLKIKNEVVGVIQVMSLQRNAYNDNDLRFLEALSPQMAVAMQNAILYQKDQNEIAERKKALMAFQISEHKYRQLFESIPNPVLIVERKTLEIINVNEAAIKNYGYSYEEFLSFKLTDIRPKEDVPKLLKLLRETRSIYKTESRHLKKDGSLMYAEITSYPMIYDGNEVLIVLINDVTGKRAAQEEINKKKVQLQNIFDNLDNVIWSADLEIRKLLQISPSCEKVFGRTQKEFYDNFGLWFDIIHPEDKYKVKLHEHLTSNENAYSDKYRIVFKNGEIRWIENNIKVTRNINGKIIRLDGITTDITDKMKADEALIKSEERFKQLSENAGEWIWEVNPDGLYTYSSPIVESILGYTPEEIVGKKYFYDLFEPKSKDSLKKAALKVFLEKQPIKNLLNTNVHKSGRLVVLETNGVPIIDKDGNLRGYRGADIDVTGKIKTQEALKDSEERYRALFDRSFDIVFIHDFKGNFVDCNKTGLELFGYTRDEIPNVNFTDLLEGEYLAKVIVALEELLKTGSQKEPLEFYAKSKDGRYFYIETKSSLIMKDGNPYAVQGIARDITERKKIQNKLLENERFLDSIIENIPDALFVKDAGEHRFLKVNKAAQDMFGYSKEEMIGKNDYDFFTKENADFFISKDNEVIQSRKMQDIPEESILTGKKEERYLHTKKIPIYDMDGNPLYLLGISEDISEKKKAEEALRKLSRAVEQSIVSIVITDKNGNIEYVNPQFEKISGFSSEEVMGKNPRILKSGKTDIKIYEEMWNLILNDKEWRGEILNKKKNGELYWEYSSISPIKNEKGEVTNFLAIKEDITEQKLMDVQLKESLKEKEIMLREIHHRVKNNLQIISSLLKLQSSYIKDPEVVEYFNVSQYRIKSMALIHQQLYRSESLNKIDFHEYLSTLSKDILSIYFQRGRKIKIDVDSKNIFFGIDTAIPCGLLINELLSNSLKHAFPERKNGKIILKITQNNGDKFNLFYRDDGVGLPRDYNFEHPDSMGMELIQSLVEQLDGTVEIKNESGTQYNINFTELTYKKRM